MSEHVAVSGSCSQAMILLTIPIFYPMVMGLDFWGMNLLIIQKLAKDAPYIETAKGVMPFPASDFIRIAFLVAFPGISLWSLNAL